MIVEQERLLYTLAQDLRAASTCMERIRSGHSGMVPEPHQCHRRVEVHVPRQTSLSSMYKRAAPKLAKPAHLSLSCCPAHYMEVRMQHTSVLPRDAAKPTMCCASCRNISI
eukprot:519153-Amphidinium_carterae.1